MNGTRLSASMLPPGITPDRESSVQTLTVEGRPEYNGTRVVCVANFDDDSRPSEETRAAVLYITGMFQVRTNKGLVHIAIDYIYYQMSFTINGILVNRL